MFVGACLDLGRSLSMFRLYLNFEKTKGLFFLLRVPRGLRANIKVFIELRMRWKPGDGVQWVN